MYICPTQFNIQHSKITSWTEMTYFWLWQLVIIGWITINFCFYAVHCSVEVCNYFPFKLEDGSYTTPFLLAHHKKSDLRVVFLNISVLLQLEGRRLVMTKSTNLICKVYLWLPLVVVPTQMVFIFIILLMVPLFQWLVIIST